MAKRKPDNLTLAEVAELHEQKWLNSDIRSRHRLAWAEFVEAVAPRLTVESLRPADIRRYREHLAENTFSKASRDRRTTCVRAILSYAAEHHPAKAAAIGRIVQELRTSDTQRETERVEKRQP